MPALVSALEKIVAAGPVLTDELRRRLDAVMLSSPTLVQWGWNGLSMDSVRVLLGDCRQRLALARMIANTSPTMGRVVVLDDQFAEQLPDDVEYQEADPKVVDALVEKMKAAGAEANLTADQIRAQAQAIAAIVANAPEPYRSLFIDNLDKIDFAQMSQADINAGRPAHYDPTNNTLYVDFAHLDDGAYPYVTFFHEFGHGIDDVTDWTGYTSNGSSLFDILCEDVRWNIETTILTLTNPYKDPTDSAQNMVVDQKAQAVIDAIMRRDFDWLNNLTDPIEKALYIDLKKEYSRILAGPQNVVTSDLYGGVTGNIVHGDYWHPPNRDDNGHFIDSNRNGQDDDYWFPGEPDVSIPFWSWWPDWLPVGEGRHGQETEFWAGYYSAQMTQSTQLAQMATDAVSNPGAYDSLEERMTALEVTQQRLPNASDAAAQLAEAMK